MSIRPKDALDYHEHPVPGKTAIVSTKPCVTQRDLSLAYTPGVAVPCEAIAENTEDVFRYTNKGNLVAVISNGTAVLGLGNIGPHASKPVMEGKAILFKKFANIDVFDLELDTEDPDEVVRTVQILAPTFGGVNLEDIKAPECFYIEEKLRETCDIPVFHDDQHGTAIITAAAFINALTVAEKSIDAVRVVFSGAGAAAISCARLLVRLGVKKEHLTICDSRGVVYAGRTDRMNEYKEEFAVETANRSLTDAMVNADAFVGVSVADAVTPEMVKSMAPNPIVFALANPDPEIRPEVAKAARSDVIMATGRSDYPNQVNNVLGFPFIFRGALDVRAKQVTEEMKVAAVHALAQLAQQEVTEQVSEAYDDRRFSFGPEYLIPKPFDQRVLLWVAPAVAQSAMDCGVARQPIADMQAYKEHLAKFIDPSWQVMQPIYHRARKAPKRVVFPEGHHPKIIKAAEICVDEGIAKPILLGSEPLIRQVAEDNDIVLTGVTIIDQRESDALAGYAQSLHERRARKGVTAELALDLVRQRTNFGILMVENGDADGMVSGLTKAYHEIIRPALQFSGTADGVGRAAGCYMIISGHELKFFADATVNIDPNAETLAEIAILTADFAKAMDRDPKIAMLSFSNFGTTHHPQCAAVCKATEIVKSRRPDLMVDGEMQVDVALDPDLARDLYPFSTLQGEANVLVFPDLASGNIAYKLMGRLGGAQIVGPILLGMRRPISVLQRDTDLRSVVNMAALTVVKAQGMW
jgi:malate dehydrogenase (oxaloacetate-decarboxylating)(NADP+)